MVQAQKYGEMSVLIEARLRGSGTPGLGSSLWAVESCKWLFSGWRKGCEMACLVMGSFWEEEEEIPVGPGKARLGG